MTCVHELGIATSALEAALARARDAGAEHVRRLELRVGELSGVEPEALRFALETILPGTAAEGAAVEIAPVAAIARCAECGRDFAPMDGTVFDCPECGSVRVTIRQGRELELTRMEIC